MSVRVAERNDQMYLDLGGGRVARVTGRGAEVLPANQEVDFASTDSALPLPDPDPAGDADELGRVLGLGEDDWALVLGWMLGALKEGGAHYCLVVEGESDAGKSTLCEQVTAVIDPKGSEKLKFPRNPQDVFVAARRRWVLGFDEVGRLTEDQCGTLKSITTGAAHAGRKVYTDGQEYSFRVNRPAYVNGTGCVLADPALLRRSVPLWRPALGPGRKRPDTELADAVREATPRVLGGLLNLVAAGLRTPDSGTPRARDDGMPGPAEWVCRCLRGSGRDPDRFLDALNRSRTAARSRAARVPVGRPDSDANWSVYIIPTIWTIAQDGWTGYLGDLLAVLPEGSAAGLTPVSLAKQLAAHAPALQAAGVEYETKHTKKGTCYTFRRSRAEGEAAAGGGGGPVDTAA